MLRPTDEAISLLSSNGFYENASAQRRDDRDVVFTTNSFKIRSIDADYEDDEPVTAMGWISFEPKEIGGYCDNWNVVITTSDDFFSKDGTWPDCFNTIDEAIRCYHSYFGAGGLLEERGYEVV